MRSMAIKSVFGLGLLVAASMANAQVIVQSLSTEALNDPLSRTDWTKSLTFNQFDPSLGTLNSVLITLQGDIVFTGSVTNNGQLARNVRVDVNSQLDVTGPAGLMQSILLTVSDGPKNIAPGATVGFGPSSQSQVAGPLMMATAPFIGLGTFNIQGVTTSGFSIVGGGADARAQVNTNLRMHAEVIYNYTPRNNEVPEPGTVALGVGMLTGVGALVRRRKK